jgi:hypothetical protein
MSNFIHLMQLSVASAQLSELHHVHAALAQQHNAHQRQALLADVLFHTERRAKQLSIVSGQDKLVAAMLAEDWVASVHYVSADAFFQVEHKRGWAASVGRLQNLTATLGDPKAREVANQLRAAFGTLRDLQKALGGDPERVRAELQQQRSTAERNKGRSLLFISAFPGGILLLILMALVVAVAAGGDKDAAGATSCIGTLLLFGGLGLSVYGVAGWFEARAKVRRAQEDMSRLDETLGRMHAFAAHPQGGQFIDWFYREHPSYGYPLPNVDDMGPLSGSPSSPQIIERQTVVIRCRYCRSMTPVDGPNCRNCGAGSFA